MADKQTTVISGAKNKKKAHQSRKNQSYYVRQIDVTKLNKIITLATHVGRRMIQRDGSGSRKGWACVDGKAWQTLHDKSVLDLRNALQKATRRNNLRAMKALNIAAFD